MTTSTAKVTGYRGGTVYLNGVAGHTIMFDDGTEVFVAGSTPALGSTYASIPTSLLNPPVEQPVAPTTTITTPTTTTATTTPTTTTAVAPTTTTTSTGLPYPNPTTFEQSLANAQYLSSGGAITAPTTAPVTTGPNFSDPSYNPNLKYVAVENATTGPNGQKFTNWYQTTDPYNQHYLSPSDLAYTQQQAAQNVSAYNAYQQQQQAQTQAVADAQAAEAARRQAIIDNPANYATIKGVKYQSIDPTGSLGPYMSQADITYTQNMLATQQQQYNAALANAQKLGASNVSSNDFVVQNGTWYQTQFPDMPGYVTPTQYSQIMKQVGVMPGTSLTGTQQYQAQVAANHAANDARYQSWVAETKQHYADVAAHAYDNYPLGPGQTNPYNPNDTYEKRMASMSWTPISDTLAQQLISQGPGSAAQPTKLANGSWALQTSSPYYGGYSSAQGIQELEAQAAAEVARQARLNELYGSEAPGSIGHGWKLSDLVKTVGTIGLMYMTMGAANGTLTPEIVKSAGVPLNSAAEFDSIEQLLQSVNNTNTIPQMISESGFANAADYTAALEGGFTDPTRYYNAAANGFTNAADYSNALRNGIYDAANYNSAIESGLIQPASFTPTPAVTAPIPADAIEVALPNGGTGYVSTGANGQYVIQNANGVIDRAATDFMNTSTVGPAYSPTAGPGAGLQNGGALGTAPATSGTSVATTAGKTLTDSQAATLMGTTTKETLMSSMIKGASVNAAMSAINGQSPQNILKAAMGGAVSGAVGFGISGAMDPGLLSSVASRAAASAAAALVVGADPMKSAMNGAVFAMAANLLPSQLDKIDAFKDLSQTTKDYIVNSLASGIVGATSGGNITQAMLTGAITTAVSKGVDYVYDAAKGVTLPSPKEMIDGVKGKVTDFFKSNNVQTDSTQAPETPVAPTPSTPSAPAVDTSTNIALGTGDTNADAIYNQLVANLQEGYSGSAIPGSAMAEVVNSDAGRAGLINTASINGTPAYEWTPEQALEFWNQTLAEMGKPPVGLNDPNFQSSYDRLIANPPPGVEGGTGYPKGPTIEPVPTAEPPVDIKSTGVSDQAPGTIFEVNGQREIVLENGKTVSLSDYNDALATGKSVTVDGQLESRLTGANQTRLENLLKRVENMSNEEYARQESAISKEENDILAAEIALGNKGVLRLNADGTYTNTTTGTTVYKDPDSGLWKTGPVAPTSSTGGTTGGAVAPGGTTGGTGQPASVATTPFQIGDQTYQVNTTTGLAYGADGKLDIDASRAYQQANPSATALDPASANKTSLTALIALGGGTSGGRALLGPGSTGPETPSVPFSFVTTSGPSGPTLQPNPQVVEMYQYPEPPAPVPVKPVTPTTPVTPVSPTTPPPSTEPVPPINETSSTGQVGGGGGGGGGGAPTPAPKVDFSKGGYYVDANNNVVQSSTNTVVGSVTNQGLVALDNGNFYDPTTYTEIPVNKSVAGQPGTTTPVVPVAPGGTATGGTTGTGTTSTSTTGGTPGTGPVAPGGPTGPGGTGTGTTAGGTGGTGTGIGAGTGTGIGTGAGTGTGGGVGGGTGAGTGTGTGPGTGSGTGGGTGSGEGTGSGSGSGGGGYTDQYVYPPVVLPTDNTGGTGTGTGGTKKYPFGPQIPLNTNAVNPGWLSQNTPPIYSTANPLQNQYYWGRHPYVTDLNNIAGQWNAVPNLPAQYGPTQNAVSGTAKLNIPQFTQNYLAGSNPAAFGYSPQYPGGQGYATSTAGSVVGPGIDPTTGLPYTAIAPVAP